MITPDIETAKGVLSNLSAKFLEIPLAPETVSLCNDLMQTVVEASFPGALVPALGPNGSLIVNVAAGTAAEWYRLKPILYAFAGPTITSFTGVPEDLAEGDPVSLIIMETKPAVTSVIQLPSDGKKQMNALRALNAGRLALRRAPDLQRSSPVPTSLLLAKFQDQLNLGRRDAAMELLERLKSEFRLDALNLKFLEVQWHAAFEDWASLLSLPEFPSLCAARRTPALTALLLEALYKVHLSTLFEQGDEEAVKGAYEAKVRQLAHPMLTAPLPNTLTAGGYRIYALEALLDEGRNDISIELSSRVDVLGWLGDTFAGVVAEPITSIEPAPIDTARGALLQVEQSDDTDRLTVAMQALSGLSEEQLAQLRGALPFAPIVAAVERVEEELLPRSWVEWLSLTGQPRFVDALKLAQRGKDEWPIESIASDPVAVTSLVAAIERAQQEHLSSERTAQALPYLVAWLQRDSQFPRPLMAPFYAKLLTLFALESARSSEIYGSSQILIFALLSTGLDRKGYSNLIADVEEIAGDGFGVDMIYWLLDVVEAFMNAPTPSADAREKFLHGILARILPIEARLTSIQRVAVELLGKELAWEFRHTSSTFSLAKDALTAKLDGLRIAIYSLTEASGRHAKTALETLMPSVIVDTNADHNGTQRLRALAENSDIFVLTWLSAKHAATEFIREHRGDRTLLYAQGKGFSSIIRAIEDHLKSASFRSKL